MTDIDISGFSIAGKDRNRKVHCPHCNKTIKRSVLHHIRSEHPEIWSQWKKVMLESFNEGLSPKSIMYKHFTISKRPLFTWGVIEKEIRAMIESGEDVKCPIRKDVKIWGPEEFELEKFSVWKFSSRGSWGTHNGRYRGNWAPQVPRNFILRYTQEGDTVLDGFIGGGTTVVEARLLGRNIVGFDIDPFAIRMTQEQLDILEQAAIEQKIKLKSSKVDIHVGDCRQMSDIAEESIDLVCTHPPYFNTVKYTGLEGDVSRINSYPEFLKALGEAAKEFHRVLKPEHHCAILIGDVKKNNKFYPLGFEAMNMFREVGFELEEILIKEQFKDRSMIFYLNSGNRINLSHEYLFVFKKRTDA